MSIFYSIQQFISDWGMLGAFGTLLIENIGIPFPTEVGFIVAQNLINQHEITYTLALVILVCGQIIGAILGYTIGRWGDGATKKYFERKPKLQRARTKIIDWYAKYGSATVLITRNFGYVRPWASIVAGFAKMNFLVFLAWTTLGSIIFCFVTLLISAKIIYLWQNFPNLRITMIIIAITLFFGLILVSLGKKIYDNLRN